MIKIILVGFWACLITLAAGYAASHLREAATKPAVVVSSDTRELRKTKEINVPKIRDGVVKGYIVAELSYVVDPVAMRKSPVPPDAFIVDEAFRYIYDDKTIDFDHLDTFDLDKMTKILIKNVNARLSADVVVDLGIQEFTFLTAAQAKQRL
jgi:hypothetical protein